MCECVSERERKRERERERERKREMVAVINECKTNGGRPDSARGPDLYWLLMQPTQEIAVFCS